MISVDLFFIAFMIVAYLIGSIPFGLVFSKLLKKDDLRHYGSGNIGATNAFRTGGKTLGFLTFFADFIKGSVIVYVFSPYVCVEKLLIIAASCVVGHVFSLWLILFSNNSIKGGKGVATALGIILFLSPVLFLWMISIWVIIFIIFKISALSALICFFIAPFLGGIIFDAKAPFLTFLIFLSMLIWVTHRKNIKNMINIK